MAYRDALSEARRQHRLAQLQFLVMALLCIILALGWYQASRELPALHLPPDLSQGATVRPGAVPKPNVYTFALYIWQGIHRWPTDGRTDYAKNLFQFSPYLTPKFQRELTRNLQEKALAGELDRRIRGVQEIPGHHYAPERVEVQSEGVWVVWLDLQLDEYYGGTSTPVKTAHIRYPLRVVRRDVDRTLNPWGLALDGYASAEGPRTLKPEELQVGWR